MKLILCVVLLLQAGDAWERAVQPAEEINRKLFRPTLRELAVRVAQLEQRVVDLEARSCR